MKIAFLHFKRAEWNHFLKKTGYKTFYLTNFLVNLQLNFWETMSLPDLQFREYKKNDIDYE